MIRLEWQRLHRHSLSSPGLPPLTASMIVDADLANDDVEPDLLRTPRPQSKEEGTYISQIGSESRH